MSTLATPTTALDAASHAIALRTRGVHHIALRVTDLDRARVFYIDRLGFPLLMEVPGLFLFAAGGTVFGVRGPSAETDPADAFNPFRVGLDHVALSCDDEEELRRVAAALAAAGVENTGVKKDEVLGVNYIAFRDPDGIKWEYYMADDAPGKRRARLQAAVASYFDALANGDLSRVPYAADVRLHTPLGPDGAATPLVGRDALAFLEGIVPAVASVGLLDIYVNEDLTGACAEGTITLREPATTLRVADRFSFDAEGRTIVAQENHFDPRALGAR